MRESKCCHCKKDIDQDLTYFIVVRKDLYAPLCLRCNEELILTIDTKDKAKRKRMLDLIQNMSVKQRAERGLLTGTELEQVEAELFTDEEALDVLERLKH